MKLITEIYDDSINILTEDTGGKKTYFIEGIFAQAETKNRNGRIYPKQYMENALTQFRPLIESRRAMGELNHPPTPQINLERVSHIIESMKWDGNNVVGKARVLDTPMGKIVQGLLEGCVRIGVSTRGVGSVRRNTKGINEVQSDFRLSTVDVVGDPSGPDCFVQGIMEGVEYFITDDGRLVEQTKKKINDAARIHKLSEQKKLEIFANYILELTKK